MLKPNTIAAKKASKLYPYANIKPIPNAYVLAIKTFAAKCKRSLEIKKQYSALKKRGYNK